jgi:hypothetical protein
MEWYVYEHVVGMGVRLLHSCVCAFAADHLTSLVLCLCIDSGVGLGGGLSPQRELETTLPSPSAAGPRRCAPGRSDAFVHMLVRRRMPHVVRARVRSSYVWLAWLMISRVSALAGRSKTRQGQS